MLRVSAWVGVVATASSAWLACSSSSGGGSGWTGTWSCSVTTTLLPSGGGPVTSSFMEDFTITEGSNGQISVTPVVDAGMPCSITAMEAGTTANIASSQPCDDPSGTYGGTITLNGSSLTWNYNGSDSTGGFQEQATCTRR